MPHSRNQPHEPQESRLKNIIQAQNTLQNVLLLKRKHNFKNLIETAQTCSTHIRG
jgi:hypothetical protein